MTADDSAVELPDEYIIIWIDEKGEVQVGAQGERFGERNLPAILEVASAKLRLKERLQQWYRDEYGINPLKLP